ncbi:MAG: hypothetical protein ACI8WB_003229, partial [Phenylobacterium sp.]
MKYSKNLAWIALHTGLMVAVLINLLSGLRIASLTYPSLLLFSALLPQGDMHGLHLIGAVVLLTCALAFVGYSVFNVEQKKSGRQSTYHKLVIYTGFAALCGLIVSGTGMYFNWSAAKVWHFGCALVLLAYLGLHAAVYFAGYGWQVLRLISLPSKKNRGRHLA